MACSIPLPVIGKGIIFFLFWWGCKILLGHSITDRSTRQHFCLLKKIFCQEYDLISAVSAEVNWTAHLEYSHLCCQAHNSKRAMDDMTKQRIRSAIKVNISEANVCHNYRCSQKSSDFGQEMIRKVSACLTPLPSLAGFSTSTEGLVLWTSEDLRGA